MQVSEYLRHIFSYVEAFDLRLRLHGDGFAEKRATRRAGRSIRNPSPPSRQGASLGPSGEQTRAGLGTKGRWDSVRERRHGFSGRRSRAQRTKNNSPRTAETAAATEKMAFWGNEIFYFLPKSLSFVIYNINPCAHSSFVIIILSNQATERPV